MIFKITHTTGNVLVQAYSFTAAENIFEEYEKKNEIVYQTPMGENIVMKKKNKIIIIEYIGELLDG